MARIRFSRTSLLVALGVLVLPSSGVAQTRPFLFTVVPVHDPDAPRVIAYADLAYGRDLFSGIGQEKLESRLGSQLTLGSRATLVGHLGVAAGDDDDQRLTVQVEGLIDALPPTSRALLALGVGARRDYEGTGVGLARVVAGYRWARTTAVTNLRLELPFEDEGGEEGVLGRDEVDMITTLGVAREMGSGLRLGLESVAEDLEGIFDPNEAEGGAKLLVGPSLGYGPPETRWHFLLAGGPVFRLTHSTATGSPAARDLTSRTGYVVRTALDYRW